MEFSGDGWGGRGCSRREGVFVTTTHRVCRAFERARDGHACRTCRPMAVRCALWGGYLVVPSQ
jgi:hypothetical protein